MKTILLVGMPPEVCQQVEKLAGGNCKIVAKEADRDERSQFYKEHPTIVVLNARWSDGHWGPNARSLAEEMVKVGGVTVIAVSSFNYDRTLFEKSFFEKSCCQFCRPEELNDILQGELSL
ncbi:DUF3617 domain-containing protein [Patescibacteria group bacterium]|nr:DUF3617 domain-containing protein [Patescibacteria group bacterium]